MKWLLDSKAYLKKKCWFLQIECQGKLWQNSGVMAKAVQGGAPVKNKNNWEQMNYVLKPR